MGETHLGAYAEKARVKGDWLVRLPDGMSTRDAMAIGTAGYTAMLAVTALEKNGVTPASSPVVVTGAAGGLGSMAVTLLASLGYTVEAVTGRPHEADYLRELGASVIVDRAELTGAPKPLAKERWGGGIDTVGGATLANVLAAVRGWGAVAACGNAGGMELPGFVAPFILRGVTLTGIESVRAPRAQRIEAWRRLAADLDRAKLARMTTAIDFHAVVPAAHDIVAGKVRGRLAVTIG
jgi:acrylyl-CoA reductase (NADPH)